MASPPANEALWLPSKNSKSFEIHESPYPTVGVDQVVVQNRAIAFNPIDYGLQDIGGLIAPWLKYPCILGSDIAGEIVEVGSGITRFKVGDRVLGLSSGLDKDSTGSGEGAFQRYTAVRDNLCCPIPASMTYVDASTLPLSVSTAATSLFSPDLLDLAYPTIPPKPRRQAVLVWGGSSSVGCSAIQLAAAAGYEIVTTASPKNFDLVRRLGASHAFDYSSTTVMRDIVTLLKEKKCAGAIAIGPRSIEHCIDIVAASPSAKGRKFVTQVSAAGAGGTPSAGMLGAVKFAASFVTASASLWLKARAKGVDFKFVWGSDLKKNDVGYAIYRDFLPEALEQGAFVPAPPAEVVGHGLPSVAQALNTLRKGVSAKKLVITLDDPSLTPAPNPNSNAAPIPSSALNSTAIPTSDAVPASNAAPASTIAPISDTAPTL